MPPRCVSRSVSFFPLTVNTDLTVLDYRDSSDIRVCNYHHPDTSRSVLMPERGKKEGKRIAIEGLD